MRILLFSVIISILGFSPAANAETTGCTVPLVRLASPLKGPTAIRHWLEDGAVKYFTQNTNPVTGITLDRAPADGSKRETNRIGSLGATGFSMTVLADAAVQGKMDPKEAQRLILKALEFASTLEHRNGWLPHFVDWETGKNINESEYSTIDTALFIAGAMYAAQTFPNNKEINKRANALYERLDFQDMMTNGGASPDKRTLSMGWDPRLKKYIAANWDSYSEHMILQTLGLGHPIESKRLPPTAWNAWKRQAMENKTSGLIGADLPLFAHQYPWMWMNPHEFQQAGFDPFANSKEATLRDQRLSQKNEKLAPYGIWGLSASDGPPPDYYRAYRFGDGERDKGDNNGTVCPGCVAASMVYAPDEVLGYLEKLANGPHAAKIVGAYGFVDGFNPSKDWAAEDSLGITVGPTYLSSRNLEDGAIWKTFSEISAVQRAKAIIQKQK